MLNISVATMILVIAGCFPYKEPLAQPEGSAIESRLIGEWNEIGPVNGRSPGSLLVYRFNDREYYIEVRSLDQQGKRDTIRMRGFSSSVGDARFINLQDIRNDSRGYTFVRYALSDDGTLTLQGVDDKWAKSSVLTTEQTYRFVAENLDHDWLYSKETVRLRKVSK
jgi:hypothetical protein